MLTNKDMETFASLGVHMNLDTCSALRRYATWVPKGTTVGLRVDPEIRAGYGSDPKLMYGQSKFGFLQESFEQALQTAYQVGLEVDTVHMHLGWGLHQETVGSIDMFVQRIAALAKCAPSVRVVNLGGGLGARRRGSDMPVMPEDLVPIIRAHLTGLNVGVACEPGTFMVDHAGMLLLQVNTVERKGRPSGWA